MGLGRLRTCLVGMIVLTSGACASAEDDADTQPTTTPHLLALSTYAASLGTPIDAFIANPPPADATKIELLFDGTFTHPDGRVEDVHLSQETARTDAGAVRWGSFGPFSNPFTP